MSAMDDSFNVRSRSVQASATRGGSQSPHDRNIGIESDFQ